MGHFHLENIKRGKLMFHAMIVVSIMTVISLILNDLLSILFNHRFHIDLVFIPMLGLVWMYIASKNKRYVKQH